jgi:hypothetical protein
MSHTIYLPAARVGVRAGDIDGYPAGGAWVRRTACATTEDLAGFAQVRRDHERTFGVHHWG